jgi:hypothetical protein
MQNIISNQIKNKTSNLLHNSTAKTVNQQKFPQKSYFPEDQQNPNNHFDSILKVKQNPQTDKADMRD